MKSRPFAPRPIFFGWWIAASGFLSQFLVGALAYHSFGTYVVLMQNDFGWSRTTFSIAFSMQRAESGFLGPFQGWLIDRFGPRKVMVIGLVMFAFGFFALSAVNEIWQFYLSYLLLAIGASLGSWMAYVVALVNWFRRRRTLALTFLSLGFAVGGFLASPMAIALEEIGWRAGSFISGVLVLVIGIPLALVARHRPEPYGLLPDGARTPEGMTPDDLGDLDDETGMSAREALKTPAFWCIGFGQAAALLVIGALMVHLVVYMDEDLGYSLGLAAFAITIQTIGQIVGQVVGAYAGDRWPKRPLIVVAMFGHSLAILLLAWFTSLSMVYVAVSINGVAWGLRAPLQTAVRADYFGRKSFGAIMGFSSLITMFGMIGGPIFAGYMYDATGSYETSFVVLGILAALGSVLFVIAGPPKRAREPSAPQFARAAPMPPDPRDTAGAGAAGRSAGL